MQVTSYSFSENNFVPGRGTSEANDSTYQLVLGFGEKELLKNGFYARVKEKFPAANILLCSTAGEIFNMEVMDHSVSLVGLSFQHTELRTSSVNIDDYADSYQAGVSLITQLEQKDLSYVLVISDGGKVNGSELVRGMESVVQHKIPITGGLAGDGANFVSTSVGLNEEPIAGRIAAIGFYGKAIRIGHGSVGGWEMFGPERVITKSTANQLYEIDGKNALELYKLYLGKYADELPGSALLFPLSIKLSDSEEPIVRTILSIDEETKSMVFAGDVPAGSKMRFMKANFDRLIDAATEAARDTLTPFDKSSPKLALLISCVGRKLVLNKRVDEEVEAVSEVLGGNTILSGFYSYGEISPLQAQAKCELHNQTMTITTFDEIL